MGDPYTEDIESGVRTEEARLLARTENASLGAFDHNLLVTSNTTQFAKLTNLSLDPQ